MDDFELINNCWESMDLVDFLHADEHNGNKVIEIPIFLGVVSFTQVCFNFFKIF